MARHGHLHGPLIALRSGLINYDEFHRQTRPYWERQAYLVIERVRRQHYLPAALDQDDVAQEIELNAWELALSDKWDPARGPLDRWVIWNACKLAERNLHRARAAYKLSAKSPSRCPVAAAALNDGAPMRGLSKVDEGYGETIGEVVHDKVGFAGLIGNHGCVQDNPLDRADLVEQLVQAAKPIGLQMADAILRTANAEGAARRLYAQRWVRITAGWSTQAQARRAVHEAIAALAAPQPR